MYPSPITVGAMQTESSPAVDERSTTDPDRRQQDVGPPPGQPDRRVTPSGRGATDALKMACPFCGGSESAVLRTRGLIRASAVRRRRECLDCGERFPTTEAVDLECLQRELALAARHL
jgi:hypothetical protein